MIDSKQSVCAVCSYPLGPSQPRCPECGSFYRRVPVHAPGWMMVIVWVIAGSAAIHVLLAWWSSRDAGAFLSVGLQLSFAVVLGLCALVSFLLGAACKRYQRPEWAIVYCLCTAFGGLVTLMSFACWG